MSQENSKKSSKKELEAAYADALKKLPSRAPIFLPTDKMPLEEALVGVRRVDHIYKNTLNDVYRPKLRALREKHKGQKRCFIIGNGPSLNETDLACLDGEVTFTVNSFFLKSKDLDWTPTYYVVEDHLVAEDRKEWIDKFKGPTKFFPAYLGYCFEEADDTIFYNHRPRKSYPDGFDFSEDAAKITYTGCTVTFSCMQLAHYMGFEEIYLIGVDASYEIPKDTSEGKDYAVGVLDMQSDDPNHFDPDYFGKGFRWHDPQVHKMIEAYQEAKKVTDASGRSIYNAGIGGKLEVYDRVPFSTLFPQARSPETMLALNEEKLAAREKKEYPKVLMYDITLCGDGTATGEVKRNLFGDWPVGRLGQFYSAGRNQIRWSPDGTRQKKNIQAEDAFKAAVEFDPDVILYRPVMDNPTLHETALKAIKNLNVPVVTWYMDDWPERFKHQEPVKFAEMEPDLKWLLNKSNKTLSIGSMMSEAYKERYGRSFISLANGVLEAEWPEPNIQEAENRPFVVRYAGSLAENMTLDSLKAVATAVETLSKHHDIVFEIKTRPIWYEKVKDIFAPYKKTSFLVDNLSPEDYRAWIRGGDALVIAYNFDLDSTRYTRYSVANKMPECLASGVPLIAHGPSELATIDLLKSYDCALVVDTPDQNLLRSEIERLLKSLPQQKKLSQKGREMAFSRHNLLDLREQLRGDILQFDDNVCQKKQATPAVKKLEKPANMNSPVTQKPEQAGDFPTRLSDVRYPREAQAGFDETFLIYKMYEDKKPGLMIDVGAHYGGSARPFAKKEWTVYCQEPDPKNREHLTRSLGKNPHVTIDPRAVGEESKTGVVFYSSDESTGISGMLKFRDTHVQSATVDVTTVEDMLDLHNVSHVDFLKIDVEGYDFGVLKGVPWDRMKPDVIECEFEDAKTKHLGHSWDDICDYLVARGYTVYVSEWHPIIRYGISHDWAALKKYPCQLNTEQAWGNLLAFKNDPGDALLCQNLQKVMKTRNADFKLTWDKQPQPSKTTAAAPVETKPSSAMPSNPVPAVKAVQKSSAPQSSKTIGSLPSNIEGLSFAEKLRLKSPILFRVAQIAKWSLRFMKRHLALSFLGAVLIAVLIVAPIIIPAIATFKWVFWGIAGVVGVAAIGAMGLSFMNVMATRVAEREMAAREDLKREILLDLRQSENKTDDKLRQSESKTDDKLEASVKSLRAESGKLRTYLQEEAVKRDAASDGLSEKLKQNVSDMHKSLSSEISKSSAGQAQALKTLENRLSEYTENDETQENIDNMRQEMGLLAQELGKESQERSALRNELLNLLEESSGNNKEIIEALQEDLTKRIEEGNEKQSSLKDELESLLRENSKSNKHKLSILEEKMLTRAHKQDQKVSDQVSDLETKTDSLPKNLDERLSKLNKYYQSTATDLRTSLELEKSSNEALTAEVKKLRERSDELTTRIEEEAKRNSTGFMVAQDELENRLTDRFLETEKEISEAKSALKESESRYTQLDNSLKEKISGYQNLIEELQASISDLSNKSKDAESSKNVMRKDMDTRLDKTAETLKSNSSDLDQTKSQMKTALKELEEAKADLKELQDSVSKDAVMKKDSEKEKAVSFQHFNRALTKSHISELKKNWIKPLNLVENDRSLAYMASRIVTLENTLKGRLATSIENAVLRTLVTKSINGDKLRVLEIGVLFGIGLAMIYDRTVDVYKSVHVTAIDPLEGYYGNDALDIVTNEKVTESVLRNNMSAAHVPEDNFTLIQGFSTQDDIIEQASKETYDVLVIDGDHSYAGVKADFVNYAPFVSRGGYILIDDDSSPEWPEITKYVDDELLGRDDITLVGRTWRTAVFRVIQKVKP